MTQVLYPSLYQVNTRVWLTSLSKTLGRPAQLDDIPDAELDRLAEMGFDWVWFLSVWQTGPAGQTSLAENPGWRREFEETLPDLREDRHRRLRVCHHRLHRPSAIWEAMRRWLDCANGLRNAV